MLSSSSKYKIRCPFAVKRVLPPQKRGCLCKPNHSSEQGEVGVRTQLSPKVLYEALFRSSLQVPKGGDVDSLRKNSSAGKFGDLWMPELDWTGRWMIAGS